MLLYVFGWIVERLERRNPQRTNLGEMLMYPARLVPRALRVYALVAGFALLSGSGLTAGELLKRALDV